MVHAQHRSSFVQDPVHPVASVGGFHELSVEDVDAGHGCCEHRAPVNELYAPPTLLTTASNLSDEFVVPMLTE